MNSVSVHGYFDNVMYKLDKPTFIYNGFGKYF